MKDSLPDKILRAERQYMEFFSFSREKGLAIYYRDDTLPDMHMHMHNCVVLQRSSHELRLRTFIKSLIEKKGDAEFVHVVVSHRLAFEIDEGWQHCPEVTEYTVMSAPTGASRMISTGNDSSVVVADNFRIMERGFASRYSGVHSGKWGGIRDQEETAHE